MKILTAKQMQALDAYTIANEPIASVDLMERAALCAFDEINKSIKIHSAVYIFCGSGNNGGDGLVIARYAFLTAYTVRVFALKESDLCSPDYKANAKRLEDLGLEIEVLTCADFHIPPNAYVVDALFGTGLNAPLKGLAAQVVDKINASGAKVFSIDLPSGVPADADFIPETAVHAHLTLSFQLPKMCFIFPQFEQFVGDWKCLDIGLSPKAIQETESNVYFTEKQDVVHSLMPVSRFAHKGQLGHALLLAGSKGMMGAAILAGKSALHSGLGLLTLCVPRCGETLVQTAVPEALCVSDVSDDALSSLPIAISNYSAIGVGPGISMRPETQKMLLNLLKTKDLPPLVLDADALNILAQHPETLAMLPNNSILSPHPKEFERLSGVSVGTQQWTAARDFARKWKLVVVLKGRYSAVCLPNGEVHFNSTGNRGMAKGGSGDVLTGIVCSLLAQGYAAHTAAKLGCYLHGLAGDFAAEKQGFEAMLPSDLIAHLGKAFVSLKSSE